MASPFSWPMLVPCGPVGPSAPVNSSVSPLQHPIEMPELAKESIALFAYLLPGFLAAWVLYGFTSDPKPSQFERVIQALIFTFLVHATLPFVQFFLEYTGQKLFVVRPWDKVAEELTKVFIAFALGSILAFYTNNDAIHEWLRAKGLTTRTSFPSEWFGVFSRTVTFVVLHLNDDRRLFGWPKEWPNESDKGHFYIMDPSWILEDGTQLDLPGVEGILVATKDVKWVEFISQAKEQKNA
jgi:hypothetical protein